MKNDSPQAQQIPLVCTHRWCHVDRKLHPAAERCPYCKCPNENYRPGDHAFKSRTFGSPYCECGKPFDASEHNYTDRSPSVQISGGGRYNSGKVHGFEGDTIAADLMQYMESDMNDADDWRERGIDDDY